MLHASKEIDVNRTEWKKMIHVADPTNWDKDFVDVAVAPSYSYFFTIYWGNDKFHVEKFSLV